MKTNPIDAKKVLIWKLKFPTADSIMRLVGYTTLKIDESIPILFYQNKPALGSSFYS